jgi:amidophosphoribosyltransferase
MVDHFREGCGVFGIFGHPEAVTLTYLGLHALQHRGQESAGIVSSDGQRLSIHKGMGLVADVFTVDVLKKLRGFSAIGHVRYSTSGASSFQNAQPIKCMFRGGDLALAHNGNLVNFHTLRTLLMGKGHIFQSSSDSEVLLHLIASEGGNSIVEGLMRTMKLAEGAYSLVLLGLDFLVAMRDPRGFRPLCLGKVDGSPVVASETTSLDLIGATYEREVMPGEIIVAKADGIKGFMFEGNAPLSRCVFEFIYFARPDSIVFSKQAYEVRKELGRQLALEKPVPNADVVIPVPDSGVAAAIGFAQALDLPFDMGLIRSHYVGRTFIEPEQKIRHFGVKLKLNPVSALLRNRVVVVVDDSIVRGTTSRKIVEMVRSKGAKEVHLRISSPLTRWPCFYGIDTPSKDELIASRLQDEEEIARVVTADSVGYLSVEGMHKAISGKPVNMGFCDACFTGRYPVQIESSYSPDTERGCDV